MFYGGLPSLPRRFNFIDMSENYFEGKVLDYAPSNAFFWMNCLQNVSNQKTLEVCASFYAKTFDNFGQPNSTQPTTNDTPGKSNKKWIYIGRSVREPWVCFYINGVGLTHHQQGSHLALWPTSVWPCLAILAPLEDHISSFFHLLISKFSFPKF